MKNDHSLEKYVILPYIYIYRNVRKIGKGIQKFIHIKIIQLKKYGENRWINSG